MITKRNNLDEFSNVELFEALVSLLILVTSLSFFLQVIIF